MCGKLIVGTLCVYAPTVRWDKNLMLITSVYWLWRLWSKVM